MAERKRLTIEKLVLGGRGLAHLDDGRVVLVDAALPGEEVVVEEVLRRRDYVQARLLEVLVPSSLRAVPPCPYSALCGGCDFQHVAADRQVELKSEMLREQLVRSSFVSDPSPLLEPPLAAPQPFHYRQRIRLLPDSGGRPGFRRAQSHQVVPVAQCMLACAQLNRALRFFADHPLPFKLAPLVGEIELLAHGTGEAVILLLHLTRKPRPAEKKAFEAYAAPQSRVSHLLLTAAGHGRIDCFDQEKWGGEWPLLAFEHQLADGGLALTVEPGGFCQINPAQNERMIDLVLAWSATDGSTEVLDLYCGMGNFSLPLARRARQVTGMDLQRAAIRGAERNARLNKIGNCRFERASALDGARRCLAAGLRFDLVLLDPPRQGCGEVIELLPALGARHVIVISCDPATLCRDLPRLEGHGYLVTRAVVVDMFPQTHHMESVVLLTRRGG